MSAGRPLMFKSAEDLQEKIDAYYVSCWREKLDMYGSPIFRKDDAGKKTKERVLEQFKPYTITGLAVALDTSRETLLEYEERDEYVDTIKRAKQVCHNYAEDSLFMGKNPTGAIFNLKNNYGWKDKTEVEHGNPIRLLLDGYGLTNEGNDATETDAAIQSTSDSQT